MSTPNPREEAINFRMKRLYAMGHCPQCGLLPREHDDNTCDLHYEEDEVCVQDALKLPPLESLCLLVGDYGSIV